MAVLENIAEKIKNAKKIAILYHVNADGDAIGSGLALYQAIVSNHKTVDVFGEEEVLKQYRFLPYADKIQVKDNFDNDYDLVISVDSGDLKRLGKRISIFESAKSTINIDHHKGNTVNADLNYVVESSSSCGELIYNVIKTIGCKIDSQIAVCLYTAISTDTGNFRFSNTTSTTHRIAAELIEAGVKPSEVNMNIYDNSPIEKLKLLAKVLDNLELIANGKVAVLQATIENINSSGGTSEFLDNIANYGLSVENVELAILLKEQSETMTKISLRSKKYFDCSRFAREFDGGGHERAAGCSINSPLVEAKKMIVNRINEVKFE